MPIAIPQISSRDEPGKHNLETGRLDSFNEEWPHSGGQCSKDNMAKAGFFYTGPRDRVKCFVCNIKLEGWNPEEDGPWQKHLEASPNCLFAQLGKEEGQLTVEQFLDVFCNQAMNKLDSKLEPLLTTEENKNPM